MKPEIQQETGENILDRNGSTQRRTREGQVADGRTWCRNWWKGRRMAAECRRGTRICWRRRWQRHRRPPPRSTPTPCLAATASRRCVRPPKPPVPEQQRLLAELTDFCRDRSEGRARDMCAPCACGSRDALPALYRPIGWRERVAGVRAQVSVSEVSLRDGTVMSTWCVTNDDICYASRINGLDKRRPRFCFGCNYFYMYIWERFILKILDLLQPFI